MPAGEKPQQEQVYVVAKASVTFEADDLARAGRRAHVLEQASFAAVRGRAITDEAEAAAKTDRMAFMPMERDEPDRAAPR